MSETAEIDGDLPKTKFERMREGRPWCRHCGYADGRHIAGWCVADPDTDEDEDWD